jgi:hypothetical protein
MHMVFMCASFSNASRVRITAMSYVHHDDQLVQVLVTGAYKAASAEYSMALRLIKARGLEAPRHLGGSDRLGG